MKQLRVRSISLKYVNEMKHKCCKIYTNLPRNQQDNASVNRFQVKKTRKSKKKLQETRGSWINEATKSEDFGVREYGIGEWKGEAENVIEKHFILIYYKRRVTWRVFSRVWSWIEYGIAGDVTWESLRWPRRGTREVATTLIWLDIFANFNI